MRSEYYQEQEDKAREPTNHEEYFPDKNPLSERKSITHQNTFYENKLFYTNAKDTFKDSADDDKKVNNIQSKPQRKRRKKKNVDNNLNDECNHVCNLCKKRYMSYPALYTHKRNKHNVIPITGKDDIFKNIMQKNKIKKFKYSEIESSTLDIKVIIEQILVKFKEVLRSLYQNEKCLLFNPQVAENHVAIKILEKIKSENMTAPTPTDSIDEVMILYLVNFFKVSDDLTLIDSLLRFIILLREHLNIVGWDYTNTIQKLLLQPNFSEEGDYTSKPFCEEVPDFVNEFNAVFVKLDPNFGLSQEHSIDLTKNFCNWLFVNNLTNLKICDNEL